jgi:predicted N-acetyltransferase YhbS
MGMSITIRRERPEDYRETEILTREAFWDLYKPGCDEHLVAHKLREAAGFVGELDLVACEGERIVGNIMYMRSRVLDSNGQMHEVLCLGPVSVLPTHQGRGIGGRLIKESIALARELGFGGVFLMGNPAYYSKFGFRNAKEFGVLASDGKSHDYFMGLELAPGRLKRVSGNFIIDDVYYVSVEELEEFEKFFPKKEKHITSTQLPH